MVCDIVRVTKLDHPISRKDARMISTLDFLSKDQICTRAQVHTAPGVCEVDTPVLVRVRVRGQGTGDERHTPGYSSRKDPTRAINHASAVSPAFPSLSEAELPKGGQRLIWDWECACPQAISSQAAIPTPVPSRPVANPAHHRTFGITGDSRNFLHHYTCGE